MAAHERLTGTAASTSDSKSTGSSSGKGNRGGDAWWPRQQCLGGVLFGALLATAAVTVVLRLWQEGRLSLAVSAVMTPRRLIGRCGASADQQPAFSYDALIQEDLAPWREHGITEDLVEEAMSEQFIACWWVKHSFETSAFRFQVVDGRLWVTHFPWAKYPEGVVPAGLTPWDKTNWAHNWTAASKGRVPLMIVALLDVLRSFPGEIPDLDAVLSTADIPCVPKQHEGRQKPPPAMLNYCRHPNRASILVPDYASWGNEGSLLAADDGRPLRRIDDQLHHLRVESARRWVDKVPQAFWVGRILHGWPRDAGRQAFEQCVNAVRMLEPARAELLSFNNRTGLTMQEWCQYRYLLYLESGAWATKYRHLLACGAVFFSPPITYPDFFLRALTPGVDFIQLAAKDSCLDMLVKVAEMEALLAEKRVSGGLTPADLLAPLLTHSRLAQTDFQPPRFLRTKRDGSSARPEDAGDTANHSWGSALDPWEIGWNAQRFSEERLSLPAVRRAFRDVLVGYGRLMKYKPRPTPGAACYDGLLALRGFGPNPADAADALEAHPWLIDYGVEDCRPFITGNETWAGHPRPWEETG